MIPMGAWFVLIAILAFYAFMAIPYAIMEYRERPFLNLQTKGYTPQSKLAAWMEENIPEGLAVLSLPEPMRRRLRTSNMAENLNRQVRRRTRVAGLFPNESSLLRLVSAVLSEISEEWETGKIYLNTEGMPA